MVKSLSEIDLDASMHKYFLEDLANNGTPDACDFSSLEGLILSQVFVH